MLALFIPPSPLRLALRGCGSGGVLLRLWRHVQKARHNLQVALWQTNQWLILILHTGNLTNFLAGGNHKTPTRQIAILDDANQPRSECCDRGACGGFL
jgi:hypothetical protein